MHAEDVGDNEEAIVETIQKLKVSVVHLTFRYDVPNDLNLTPMSVFLYCSGHYIRLLFIRTRKRKYCRFLFS